MRGLIESGIEHWENGTRSRGEGERNWCVKFVPWDGEADTYVEFSYAKSSGEG